MKAKRPSAHHAAVKSRHLKQNRKSPSSPRGEESSAGLGQMGVSSACSGRKWKCTTRTSAGRRRRVGRWRPKHRQVFEVLENRRYERGRKKQIRCHPGLPKHFATVGGVGSGGNRAEMRHSSSAYSTPNRATVMKWPYNDMPTHGQWYEGVVRRGSRSLDAFASKRSGATSKYKSRTAVGVNGGSSFLAGGRDERHVRQVQPRVSAPCTTQPPDAG